jgi:hypothetical protein
MLAGGGERGVSIDFVFNALREELLARNYLMSNLYAFQTVTPQQRWQDWLRVNDRVVIEAAALPVEQYLIEVKDPTEAELKDFYEKYKNNEAAPDLIGGTEIASARPGFRVPRKIDAQFVQANFEELVSKAEGEVTDPDIAKYYEENKELFIKADTGLLDDTTQPPVTAPTDGATTEPAAPADPETAAPSATESNTSETPSSEAPATPAKEPKEEDAATPEAPSTETPPATTDGAEPPADDAAEPATPPATETPSTETSEAPEAEKSSQNEVSGRSAFRQVAFLQEDTTNATEEKSETAPAESAAPAEGTAPATEAAPANEAAAPVSPSTAPPVDPADLSVPATTDPAATTTAPAVEGAAAPTGEKPKEYQPLEEVRDLIRRDIAYRRVTESLDQKMNDLLDELKAEFTTYFGKVLDAESRDEKAPAPQPALADLAPLAEKNGLTPGKTGALPWLEFRDTPVGKSQDPKTGAPLSSTFFGSEGLELYQPVLTVDVDGNRYISMKTSDTPASVPKFDDIKAEVARAWKMQKASEFALKAAEKDAKAAQESGSSLVDFFSTRPGIEVVKVDPFSQMTRGDVPDQFGNQRFRLSQPDGIAAPGPDFLRKAFELKDGEVGAALNNDHSIAYVIRAVEHQNSEEELRNAYLAEANTWDGLTAMMDDHVTIAQRLVSADLSGGKGLDWKRNPDRRGEQDENDDDATDEASE